jgi:uncharacterized protein YprB with RNaseH-like and TPR domain
VTESAFRTLAKALGGRVLQQYDLEIIVVEEPLPAHVRQGACGVISHLVDACGAGGVTARSGSIVGFLDVETTGLSAGAGTLVFLIGFAEVKGESVVVRQYFLESPAAEPAILSAVARYLEGCGGLITFNGRRFDVPLLLGRFDLHLLDDPVPGRHVDLLHLARRIWGRRLRQSNLMSLEARVLGVIRQYDLPGSEAPARYFAYLRGRQVDGILPVLEHNRRDLLSIVQLAVRIGRMIGDAHEAAEAAPSDLLGLGSIHEDHGRLDRARRCYEAALIGASAFDRAEALFRLARLADPDRDVDRMIQLLETVADFKVDRAVAASIELAKILEHRKREPERALHYARRAQTLLQAFPHASAPHVKPEVSHRIRRLERKVARGLGGPFSSSSHNSGAADRSM